MVRIIDNTITDLTVLIENDFGKIDQSLGFDNWFLRWLHYRARKVVALPRTVIVSTEVASLKTKYPAINSISQNFVAGADLEPWLGSSVQKHRKKNYKGDPLFNDWQINHFHLGAFYESPTRIRRTKDILFVFISAKNAVLLDVAPHGRGHDFAWVNQKLLEILLRTSPQDMERYELKGVHPPRAGTYEDDERKDLRSSGISTSIFIDGRTFAPGLGITTSGHATRLVFLRNRLFRSLRNLVLELESNRPTQPIASLLLSSIGVPVHLGIKFDGCELIAYCKIRGIDFLRSGILQ